MPRTSPSPWSPSSARPSRSNPTAPSTSSRADVDDLGLDRGRARPPRPTCRPPCRSDPRPSKRCSPRRSRATPSWWRRCERRPPAGRCSPSRTSPSTSMRSRRPDLLGEVEPQQARGDLVLTDALGVAPDGDVRLAPPDARRRRSRGAGLRRQRPDRRGRRAPRALADGIISYSLAQPFVVAVPDGSDAEDRTPGPVLALSPDPIVMERLDRRRARRAWS